LGSLLILSLLTLSLLLAVFLGSPLTPSLPVVSLVSQV